MNPLAFAIAGGAASAFGSYMNQKQQRETNEMNQAIAREQMAFQERMSSSAHQRQAKDLEAAGLNRILSATGGSGASAPSGAASTALSPRVGDMLKDTVNSGLAAANLESDLAIKDAGVAKTLADTANSLEQSKILSEQTAQAGLATAKQRAVQEEQIEREKHMTTEQRYKASERKAESERSRTALEYEQTDLERRKSQSEIDKDFQKYDNVIRRVTDGIDAATSALNVSRYLRSPTVKPGSRAERRALERAGSKGLEVKK